MKRVFQKAKWIGTGKKIVPQSYDYLSPAVQFRKEFVLMEIGKKAWTCRICGLGCFVLFINGKRVADDVLSPAFTDYNKRVLYVEYNVRDFLWNGKNVLSVKVGNGFYNQPTKDTWGFYKADWRTEPKLLLELYEDENVVVSTDETWKVSENGATIHNAIRTGEYYDARKEDGWKENEYDDSVWKNAVKVEAPRGVLASSAQPPIRECETFTPIKKWKSTRGWVFDFGQNMSGYVSLCMKGESGKTAVIRYAEKLEGKELDQKEISLHVYGNTEFSVDKYTFKGTGKNECWKPQFVYHGFRYVEISGMENEPPMSALTAHFVHTDLEKKGSFSCSNELLSWIYKAGIYSFLSNYHGFPTDCPHREKNGWTGDAAISTDYAVLLFDMKAAYKKWLQDIADAQRENGQLPGIVPTFDWGFEFGSGPAWDCALFFLPYALYKETGDVECLFSIYDTAKKYLSYARSKRENELVCYGLFDWCPPSEVRDLRSMDNRLSDSCYYYKMQKIMSEIAMLKGNSEEADLYRQEAEKTKTAILKTYVKEDHVDNDGQASLAEVLFFDIVEGEQARKIARRLVERVQMDEYKFKAGMLGMKALLNALSAYGYTDVAYKMVNRYDYPSYGYWKKEFGATTLLENWDGEASWNHHMYNDVLHWMFRNVGGLQNIKNAYSRYALKPFFYAEECWATCETITPKGKISFRWKKSKDTFQAEIDCPQKCEGWLYLPNQKPIPVVKGKISIRLS